MKMTENILGFAESQSNLKRFVFLSTSEVYAGTLEEFGLEFPTPESTPLSLPDLSRPRTSYMLSKLNGEALCHYSSTNFTIVRPHNIYGPRMGMAHAIPELLKKAHEADPGGSLDVYSTDHTRTFCYIQDAVEFIIRAARSERARGNTYNVGRETPEITIDTLAKKIIDVVNKNLRINPLPPTSGSPERRCPDTERIREVTDYEPQTDLEEGLRTTYDWYKSKF
jgi:nucleoside-diphosphate-sugar epimerase